MEACQRRSCENYNDVKIIMLPNFKYLFGGSSAEAWGGRENGGMVIREEAACVVFMVWGR